MKLEHSADDECVDKRSRESNEGSQAEAFYANRKMAVVSRSTRIPYGTLL